MEFGNIIRKSLRISIETKGCVMLAWRKREAESDVHDRGVADLPRHVRVRGAVRAGLEIVAAVTALKSSVPLQTPLSGEAQERGIVGETVLLRTALISPSFAT